MLPVCDPQVSDERLVALACSGNEEAFATLVSRFSSTLHRLSVKLGGQSDAEDLAQEGLLGLLSAVQTYRSGGGAAFATYAYACMRNRMLSSVRCTQNKPSVSSLEDEPSLPATAGEDPAVLVVRLEELKSLRAHLRSVLTEREYHVLMRYLASYSYEEIAADLSISRKSVDNALMRLRRKLSAAPFLTRL